MTMTANNTESRWVFERSSGYAGYRCSVCAEWIYSGNPKACQCNDYHDDDAPPPTREGETPDEQAEFFKRVAGETAATTPTPSARAALRIWQLVDERGQDALSHVDYQRVIDEEMCGKHAGTDAAFTALIAVRADDRGFDGRMTTETMDMVAAALAAVEGVERWRQ